MVDVPEDIKDVTLTSVEDQGGDGEESNVTGGAIMDTTKVKERIIWSKALASPSTGDAYTPAKQMLDKGSLHGASLLKALDRAKMKSRSGHRCSLMILEGARCYEEFAASLAKSLQSIQMEDEAFKSIRSLSQQTLKLSSWLKHDIGDPIQAFHTTYGDTILAILKRYSKSRQQAHQARERALLAREKYLVALKIAEEVCKDVHASVAHKNLSVVEEENKLSINTEKKLTATEVQVDDKSESKKNWETLLEEYGKLKGQDAVDHASHALSDLKVLENRYRSLVEKENQAVKVSQTLEAFALDSIQKLDEQRLRVLFCLVTSIFEGIKTCLDDLIISGNTTFETATKETKFIQKKGDFFATFLKGGQQTGSADSETLGIAPDIGRLRDEMQTCLAAKMARIQKVRTLILLFDSVATAATKLGDGLQQIVKHEDSYVSSKGKPVEHLRTLMSNCEGTRTLSLWGDFMKTIEQDGEAFSQLARSLRSIKSSKLDTFLPTTEKDVKEEAAQDDIRWKHVCDAARIELRADAKYRQTTAQTQKARNRIRSVDGGSEGDLQKSPQKANRAVNGMNKAFGNFLSILPDGGEQAMQMLTPDARRAVAERSLQEADEKEQKGRRALDEAMACKSRAMTTYQSIVEPIVKQHKVEEMSGLEDIKAAMESLVASVKNFRTCRLESIAHVNAEGTSITSILVDLDEWAHNLASDCAGKGESVLITRGPNDTCGFLLDFAPEGDNAVLKFAQIGKTYSYDSECLDGTYDNDDNNSINSNGVVEVTAGEDSSRSLNLSSVRDEDDETDGDTVKDLKDKNRWLKKSLSTPMGKPGFKTFRKIHSMGDAFNKDNVYNNDVDDMTESSTVSATIPPQNKRERLNTECFMAFWPDYEGVPPGVTDAFACAFIPKGCSLKQIASVEYGCLFLTHKAVCFVAWQGKKAILQFVALSDVERCDGLFGLSDDGTVLMTGIKGEISLGCFEPDSLNQVIKVTQREIADAKKARDEEEKAIQGVKSGVNEDEDAPPVLPDSVISKMETVLSRKIHNVPITLFHDTVWSDTTDDDSFYGSWLEKGNCFDIDIGKWESSSDGFKGSWCGEVYSQKRCLKFKVRRKSRIGPPVANCTQTQYCRIDSKGRSVMHMTVAFDSIPYCDTFSVEVRWVATRSGSNDIHVQVGVFVEFHKSTILKSQIRSGTLSETKPVHESLFQFVQAALGDPATAEGGGDNEVCEEAKTDEDEEAQGMFIILGKKVADLVMSNLHASLPIVIILILLLLRILFRAPTIPVTARSEDIAALSSKIDDIQMELKLMRQALEAVADAAKEETKC